MKVAAYYRVSTKGQGDEDAYGLPKQRHEVQTYCKTQGHTIVATFQDIGVSGGTDNRPGLSAMLVAEGFEAVVVPAWDRLAREATLDGYLRYSFKQRGIIVLSATQGNGIDPASVMMQGMLALVAGYEKSLIAQRLAGGRKAKARAGGYAHGTAPYGTKATLKSGVLTINDAELPNLQRIRALHAEGKGLAMRAIAAVMNAAGTTSRTGVKWSHKSIEGALKSAARVDALLNEMKALK
jgi:site-specific DNA recombinase